jgi:AGZA family xanthine/uracil permease-like MFS transporter
MLKPRLHLRRSTPIRFCDTADPLPPASATTAEPHAGPPRFVGWGDINAFFGLALDNLACLVLAVGLLAGAFQFPAEFALRSMIPGTALGVLFGDLVYTAMAVRLARRLGRDVTAMPLGLDTPSTIGMVLFVLGPAFRDALDKGASQEAAATLAWHIGICSLAISGVFKLLCAAGASWARRLLPRAGLLGSLTAIALVLISFLPLLDVFESPAAGMVALIVILAGLVARMQLPQRIPGALAAVALGSLVYYGLKAAGLATAHAAAGAPAVWLPTDWQAAWRCEWFGALTASLEYLPFVIPFALATVIGGIDCAESASAAGDDYHTGAVIAVEGLATLLAACCGGVIQTTPYIGHPAYKAMGGRAGYTLATALLIGSAGVVGYFATLYAWLPGAAVYPILIFIGLEITSQSFLATPSKHYPAVALACVPAMAYLVTIFADQLMQQSGKTVDDFAAPLGPQLQTLHVLASGFIVTSLLWASMLAALIDHRPRAAAAYLAIAGVCSLFGVIHSSLRGSPLAFPWDLPPMPHVAAGQTPLRMAAAYGGAALLLVVWSLFAQPSPPNDGSLPNHD